MVLHSQHKSQTKRSTSVLHAPSVHSQNATFFTPKCYTLFAGYLYQKHELALPGNLQSSELLPSHHRNNNNNNKRNASHYIPLPLVSSYSVSLSSFLLSAIAVGRFPFDSSPGKLCTSSRECRLKYKTGNVRINATWRRVRLIIVAMKSNTCYSLCECVCSLWYPVLNEHTPYCHPWPV